MTIPQTASVSIVLEWPPDNRIVISMDDPQLAGGRTMLIMLANQAVSVDGAQGALPLD